MMGHMTHKEHLRLCEVEYLLEDMAAVSCLRKVDGANCRCKRCQALELVVSLLKEKPAS